MQKVMFSLHLWMLKFAGIVDSPQAQTTGDNKNPFAAFRTLDEASKSRKLDDDEWKSSKEQIKELAAAAIDRAEIICCTSTMAASDLLKEKSFFAVINDETISSLDQLS